MHVWEKFTGLTKKLFCDQIVIIHIHELLVRTSDLNHITRCSQDLEFSAAGTP